MLDGHVHQRNQISVSLTMKKVQFDVHNMHCGQCVITLESIEDLLDGVECAEASLRRQLLFVEYDESRIKVDDIIAAVTRKGYQITLRS